MSLPAEIRVMILETIACRKHPGWAAFASVCREWQVILERFNFHKLKLGIPHLDSFKHVAAEREELIHHILLDIELPRYSAQCCTKGHPKRRSPPVKTGPIVSDAIWRLFSILSTWEPGDNLALEINVYSRSDCEHWFKKIYVSSDHVENDEDAALEDCNIGLPYQDLQHGWAHGRQVCAPPRSAVKRLFRPIDLKFRETLPRVRAVTSLIIRRQLRRCINPYGLTQLLSSLHGLNHMSYEPWAPDRISDREIHDYCMYQHRQQLHKLRIPTSFENTPVILR